MIGSPYATPGLIEAMRAARESGAEFRHESRPVDDAGAVRRVRGRGFFTAEGPPRMVGVIQDLPEQGPAAVPSP